MKKIGELITFLKQKLPKLFKIGKKIPTTFLMMSYCQRHSWGKIKSSKNLTVNLSSSQFLATKGWNFCEWGGSNFLEIHPRVVTSLQLRGKFPVTSHGTQTFLKT